MSDTTDDLSTEDSDLDLFLEPLETEDTDDAEDTDALPDDQTAEDTDEADEDEDDLDLDDDDEDEEADAPETPETYTVRVDGEDTQVSLEELKRGYSGQRSIHQDKTALAQERRSLQSDREQFAALVQDLSQRGVLQAPVPPDPNLSIQDPAAWAQAQAFYQEDLANYQYQQQQLQMQRQAYDQEQQQQSQTHLAEQSRLLAEEFPEYADEKTRGEFISRIGKAGEHFGYSLDELSKVGDARAVRVLNAAAQWMATQEAAKTATKKAAKARPSVKPRKGSEPSKSARKRREIQQRARSGDIDAQTALFLK